MQYSQTYDELQSSSNNLICLQHQIQIPKSTNGVQTIDGTDNSFSFNRVKKIPAKHLYLNSTVENSCIDSNIRLTSQSETAKMAKDKARQIDASCIMNNRIICYFNIKIWLYVELKSNCEFD